MREHRITRFISYTELEAYTGIPLSSIRYLLKTGRFPAPYNSPVGKMRWKKNVLDKYLEARKDKRKEKEMARHNKIMKNIDPSILIMKHERSDDYLFFMPAGLVWNIDNVNFHEGMFTAQEFDLLDNGKVGQCIYYPHCSNCKDRSRKITYHKNMGWKEVNNEG